MLERYEKVKEYEKLISESTYPFNESEKFFLENLKNELLLIIDTIKEQLKYISLLIVVPVLIISKQESSVV